MAKNKRFQKQEIFWLNLNDSEQARLADIVGELRQRRKFAPFIRDAISMLWDMLHGGRDELRRLFPEFRVRVIEVEAPTVIGDDKRANELIWEQIETGKDNGFKIFWTVEDLDEYLDQ